MFASFIITAIGGVILFFGVILLRAGLAVLVTGASSKFLDTAPKYPKYGDL